MFIFWQASYTGYISYSLEKWLGIQIYVEIWNCFAFEFFY